MDAVSLQISGLTSPPSNYWPLASREHGDRRRRASDALDSPQFLLAHHLRHASYDLAASRAGVALAGLDLSGRVNRDWLARHASRHATYRALLARAGFGAAGTCDLASLDFASASAVTAWMQYHAALHADLDAYFHLTAAST